MDMRVMILFMERRVPLNIRRIHVMDLRELIDISAYQMLPRVGVIVVQTRGVLRLQTDDMIPYIPLAILDSFDRFFEIDRFVRLRKQTMRTDLFHAGTVGDILHQLGNVGEIIGVSVKHRVDEFARAVACGLVEESPELRHLSDVGKGKDTFIHQLLLCFGIRIVILLPALFLYVVARSDIADVSIDMIALRILIIIRFNDQLRHDGHRRSHTVPGE